MHTSCAAELKVKEPCRTMQFLISQSIGDAEPHIQGHILRLTIQYSATMHPKLLVVPIKIGNILMGHETDNQSATVCCTTDGI